MIEVYAPPDPNSLFRSYAIVERGKYRFARRDCEFYGVRINTNAFGRLRVTTGTGRLLFPMPSIFSGSFVLQAGSEEGLICEVDSDVPNIMVTWREPDTELV